jgi:hypothetical protein
MSGRASAAAVAGVDAEGRHAAAAVAVTASTRILSTGRPSCHASRESPPTDRPGQPRVVRSPIYGPNGAERTSAVQPMRGEPRSQSGVAHVHGARRPSTDRSTSGIGQARRRAGPTSRRPAVSTSCGSRNGRVIRIWHQGIVSSCPPSPSRCQTTSMPGSTHARAPSGGRSPISPGRRCRATWTTRLRQVRRVSSSCATSSGRFVVPATCRRARSTYAATAGEESRHPRHGTARGLAGRPR